MVLDIELIVTGGFITSINEQQYLRNMNPVKTVFDFQ